MAYGYPLENDKGRSHSVSEPCGTDPLKTFNMTTEQSRSYFVAKFQTNKGNMYTAENHCAGAGSTCVHVANQLRKLAEECLEPDECLPHEEALSLALSATIRGYTAQLFVH